ncbi:hypothetical protein D9M73_172020 [compost metagenome]
MCRAPWRLLDEHPLVLFIFGPQRFVAPATLVDQQFRRARQRQPRRTTLAVVQASSQQLDRTGRHQIPGGVIERLREWGAGEVVELDGRPENVTFSMPKELRVVQED